ncbi:nicotinamide-nucleotide amidohydrolase family protein [Helicobacter saguini]|nr:CinA family protein [Helicobacter saguini]MWV62549.1 nicotinamide-nucleotide amidohydrolase family protein [Helicobacter saguini]MWV66777.1 nicotinamide-nucleotide amidohydrolase family protein [Helicobacter saguini]MWV69128.1 nicotinamide-nucleotide amidohydrolase family protein [Helicobacter saguini]MWV71317.1 nicotinamide-nucleotide amidohydrolase family protein [Helicobacter saguini]
MENIVEKTLQILEQNGLKISVAESCTGGYLSYLLTSINGASSVYKGGVTTYCIESKMKLLGVKASIFETFSVYSNECVEAMARGVAGLFNTQIAIATSGLATDDTSSDNFLKLPAGLVFTCVLINEKAYFLSKNYLENLQDHKIIEVNTRNLVQQQACLNSLDFLLQNLDSILK